MFKIRRMRCEGEVEKSTSIKRRPSEDIQVNPVPDRQRNGKFTDNKKVEDSHFQHHSRDFFFDHHVRSGQQLKQFFPRFPAQS